MKAKNILMSVLLAMGFIAAKAATGYPPELALVSQPVLVYNYNSITVYYDVQNIGDYTYRGHVYLYLSPDNGYYYADKYVRVCPGRIKRVKMEIPAYRPNPSRVYTVMPYYEMGNELYSFTTFEYFEPLSFFWNGPRTEHWVVINVPPRPRYYRRPGDYRYYYDGYRPPMPPPPGVAHGPMTPPPPLNPMHHTYHYHYNNGGYPAYIEWNDNHSVAPNGNNVAPQATVRPNATSGSMSHGNSGGGTNSATNSGTNSGGSSSSVRPPAPNNNSNVAPSNGGSSSGRTGNNSGNVSRPSNTSSSSNGTVSSGSSSGRTGNNSGNVSRPNNNSSSNSGTVSSGSSSGRTGNNSGNVSRPSNNSSNRSGNSSSGRNGSNSSSSSSSSTRSGSNGRR